MKEGDAETTIAYLCFREFHMLPSTFVNLPRQEKAMIVAFVKQWAEDCKTQQKQFKK
ncbi:hypothetical protein [Clostridium sp. MD294]|jgi:hypothetical protein|uniref:hypothetical protein n=1 Tax=Clostridium sp. MD294 TaxID=97138 RepID=UPI0002C90124|nr:hypothetical protein [Clostridium sp. MD294]USF30884.1 hypothetical protein C820_002328 [Clostridium sp. MD294]